MQAKTPKSILYELLTLNVCSEKPEFVTEKIGGEPHMPVFRCALTVPSIHVRDKQTETVKVSGVAHRKLEAEHTATMEALKILKDVKGLRWPEMSFEHHKHPVHSFAEEEAQLAAELRDAGHSSGL